MSLGPPGGSAVPAVFAQLRAEWRGQGALVAGGEIGFDVAELAHAGNDGADVGVVEDEAQGHFRHGRSGGDKRFEGVGASDAGFEIFRNEVGAAPILRGPFAVERERAGEGAFVERDASDDGDVFFAASGEKLVFGILIENVVDDLDGVDEAGAHGANSVGRFPAVKAEAEGANFSAAAKFFRGARDSFVLEPAVLPGVQLYEIKRFAADIFEALVHVLEDVVRRIGIVERIFRARGPAEIFGRDFCGDVKFFVRPAGGGIISIGAEDFSEKLLAVAVAVGPRGVKEIAAEIDGALKGRERFGVVGTGPTGHTPHAVANFADIPSGAAELAVAHEVLSWS